MSTGQSEPSRKRPFRRSLTRSTGRKQTGVPSMSGQSASKTTRQERRDEISRTVAAAMLALNQKKLMDWARQSPEIDVAQEAMDNAMFGFVEGTVCREEVKTAYKAWADLLVVT